MKRRHVLITLGGITVGGAVLIGTGAFTQVEAQRTVAVNVEEDSQALVGIDVNERYGGQENGVAQFDLQENLFAETGFNPQGRTILFGAMAITNNSGIEGDLMEIRLSYESDSVEVPAGQSVPQTEHDGQFYFRAFDPDDPPPGDPFDGLQFEGDPDDVGDPGALGVGETAVFDIVVDPGGELEEGEDYAVDVTITATIEGGD